VLGESVGKDSRSKRYKWNRLIAVVALVVGDTSERPLGEEVSDGEEGSSEGDAVQSASLEAVRRVMAAREKVSIGTKGWVYICIGELEVRRSRSRADLQRRREPPIALATY